MQENWFNNLFKRWSFILLAFSGIFWLAAFYLTMWTMTLLYPPDSGGLCTAIVYSALSSAIQCIVFFILIIYVFLERNPNFRIRNKVLLRLSGNIVYKIFVILSIILEIVLFLFFACFAIIFLSPFFTAFFQ